MRLKPAFPQEEQYDDEYLISLMPGFTNHYQEVDGTRLHYVEGGEGLPLILLAGWPQTWWSFHKIMPMLAKHHKVLVVDFRGMGSSSKPAKGYSKKNLAGDIALLVQKMGLYKVSIAGHDIGANIAISFAGHFPEHTEKLIVLDTPHPEEDLYKLPMLPIGMPVHPWWVAFNQVKDLPELLLEGRFHIVQSWVFDKMLVDKTSIDDFDRKVYAKAYETKDAIRSSNGWYQAFPEDIQDIKLMKMIEAPSLGIGSSAGLAMLKTSLPGYIKNLQFREIKDSGHFIQEEQPDEVASSILEFLKLK
jgi:pimeloyl-ACP methyl ester carboxylesterase